MERVAKGQVRGIRVNSPFLIIWLFLVPIHVSALDSAAAFDAANRLYAEGKFVEAAGAYEKIVEAGQVSSAIYFNLGNARFKSGQIGRAIAAYRQAEQIFPRDPDLRANLQFARNQVQGPTLRAVRWEHWLGALSLDEWAWLSVSAFWLTFALLALRQWRPSLARSLKNWTFAAGGIAVLLIASLALAFTGSSKHKTAVVIAPEVAVRNGPFEESPNAFTVRDGAELRVQDQKGGWLQVTDGTRRVGWVNQSQTIVLPSS